MQASKRRGQLRGMSGSVRARWAHAPACIDGAVCMHACVRAAPLCEAAAEAARLRWSD